MNNEKVSILAKRHVKWFLRTIEPLLIEEFKHGYKHGREDER
jgi:hypothetical protein